MIRMRDWYLNWKLRRATEPEEAQALLRQLLSGYPAPDATERDREHGTLTLESGTLRYTQSGEEFWALPIDRIKLIAEFTNEDGPTFDDYFIILAAGNPIRYYSAPMSAKAFKLDELARQLHGAFPKESLVGSTTFASLVLWPPELAGHPFYDYRPERRGVGPWARVKDLILRPLVQSEETEEIARFLGPR